MIHNPSTSTQLNLFHSPLSEMLDMSDSLIKLADVIDWSIFDKKFERYYSKEGRPAKPIRLMVGAKNGANRTPMPIEFGH